MKLTALKEYHLGSRLGQVRSVPVRLADRPEDAVLFVRGPKFLIFRATL